MNQLWMEALSSTRQIGQPQTQMEAPQNRSPKMSWRRKPPLVTLKVKQFIMEMAQDGVN